MADFKNRKWLSYVFFFTYFVQLLLLIVWSDLVVLSEELFQGGLINLIYHFHISQNILILINHLTFAVCVIFFGDLFMLKIDCWKSLNTCRVILFYFGESSDV